MPTFDTIGLQHFNLILPQQPFARLGVNENNTKFYYSVSELNYLPGQLTREEPLAVLSQFPQVSLVMHSVNH